MDVNSRYSRWSALVALALLALLVPQTSARGRVIPEALIVGDSISKLTTPYVRGDLLGNLEIEVTYWQALNADSNRAVRLVEEVYKSSESIVVFDAGTNDNPRTPRVLARNLRKVARLVGDSCMVLPTLDDTASGVSNNANTKAVFDFAASRPGTQVPEWAGVVDMRPSLRFRPHGFHPNHPAAIFRAEMVAEAIRACLDYLRGEDRGSRPDPVWLAPVDRLHRRIQSLR
jgi:hypothetical protein